MTMSVSKNLTTGISLVVCAVLTGCGGYVPTSDDVSEVRSLIEDLEAVGQQNAEQNSGDQVVTTPDVVETDETVEETVEEETVTDVTEDVTDQVTEDVTQETESENVSAATIAGQLAWEPAGYYEDGTEMSINDISHYKIVFGTSEDNLSESVEVSVAGLLTYDFEAAAGNTWFVGVKTVSIYGGESDASNLVEFNI